MAITGSLGQRKKDYVENRGRACPHCGSTNIESCDLDADGPVATAQVTCGSCAKEWTDVFTLTGVYL